MSNTIQSKELTVDEAERQLKYARLAEHKRTIGQGLAERNDEKLALGCSRFLSNYKGKSKSKAKSK